MKLGVGELGRETQVGGMSKHSGRLSCGKHTLVGHPGFVFVCCKYQQQGTQWPTVWIDLHKSGFLIYFSVPLPIFSKLLQEEIKRDCFLD